MGNITALTYDKCTGCLLCVKSCPQKCITTQEDGLGFLYPSINADECVNCGICSNRCPELAQIPKINPTKVWATLWNEAESLDGCSSGGIATLLAKIIISEGGVYFGAVSSKDCYIVYERISDLKDIDKPKGSKYVQSSMDSVYMSIKEDASNRKVLFVGTPCQCAAIEKYCKGNRNNVILVSFPCGGWSSSKILQSEVKLHIGDKFCDKVIMRNRRKVSIDIYKNGNCVFSCVPNDSYFMTALDYKLAVRKSCWNCTYSCPERIGDIVLGDYWGYQKDGLFSNLEIESGISFVGSLTYSGLTLIEKALPMMKARSANYDDVVVHNPRLKGTVICDGNYSERDREKFEKEYQYVGLKRAVLKVAFGKHLVRRIRGFVKYRLLNRKG